MKMKFAFCSLLLFWSFFSFADFDPDHEMRLSWMKDLKDLLIKIVAKPSLQLRASEKKFLEGSPLIERFQKDDLLKRITRDEGEKLKHLSLIAMDICRDKNSRECKNIIAKSKASLTAIQRIPEIGTGAQTQVSPHSKTERNQEECNDPTHDHDVFTMTYRQLSKVALKALDETYEKVKEEFLASPFCDPLKVVNDPQEMPNAFLLKMLLEDLRSIEIEGSKFRGVERIADKYKISKETKDRILSLTNDESFTVRMKGLVIQDFLKNKYNDQNSVQLVKNELVKSHVFKKSNEGEIQCPFVSKNAFMKAVTGMRQIKAKNKNIITIVDYTRPSNERRLFVIDLTTNKVLHNTWVAQGGGEGTEGRGIDGLGSSPKMSNRPGSNMSSEGFILADVASSGSSYGNNIILKGIDSNNTNLANRFVVMHGWTTPMYQYTVGFDEFDPATGKRLNTFNVVNDVKTMNFESVSSKEAEKVIWRITASVSMGNYMSTTEGCLGVSKVPVPHLDRKGRKESQLELLRKDLPGSIIFNYSGPDQKSKLFAPN